MFIALSKFTIANHLTNEVKEAFVKRPQLVDSEPGFVKLEVISPIDNPDEIWLITWWETEEHFTTWHKSHMYKESHKGIPKGLKLIPRSAELRYFNFISN